MLPTCFRRRKGFTLLELSIVLVIIGLLVGAVTGFRSYSNNARLNTMMNESKLLIDAYSQFQTRYGAPPGDYRTASSAWSAAAGKNGDGNGLIRAGSVAVPLERYYAFQHLALAGLIKGVYTGAVNGSGGATAGLNVPATSIPPAAFMFDHPDETDGSVVHATVANATYFDGMYGNVLFIAGLSANSTTTPTLAFLTPTQAMQVDDKFDDGRPGTGIILTPKSTALANCASTAVTTTAVYSTSTTTKSCYLILKVP